MTITGDRRGLEEAEREMFVLLLPHSFCYSLPLYLTVVSISHLNQVFTLPSVVIQSPWQPWQPWATEQREPTVGCLSFSLALFPISQRFNMDLLSFSLSVFLTSLLVWSRTPIPLSLTLLSPLYIFMSVPLSVKRQSCSTWWKVGSPGSHVACLVAKHIKAVRRHICHSQMMIRVPSLSKGTESSFVVKDIFPYLSVYILHQTLVRQRSHSLRF